MPPPFSSSRGMTKNPLKPSRHRAGKPVAEEPSSEEEEEEDEEAAKEAQREQERRRRAEALRRRQQAPKASSFPAGALAAQKAEEDDDEEGFVTEDEEDEKPAPKAAHPTTVEPTVSKTAAAPGADASDEEEEEEEEEEESSEEESSSEDEAPRILLRPTFIKKDKRNASAGQTQAQAAADLEAEAEARRAAQRKEKADLLIRDQLEKEAIARSSANRAWDDDELVEAEDEEAIDDTDGLDPEAERAAWELRELKRVQRAREAIEASEKELEEIERRRNLTADEREREDQEFIAKQKEERDATRGQTGFMQRYFHKGAFFRGDLEAEGLDRRELMGARFEDEVNRDTLPQYMQVRDMTKLGKKGRTRYRDLKSEDTGRFGDGLDNRRRRDGPPEGVTDERFMPDRRGGDDGDRGPTGANASVVRPRYRSRSPRRDRRDDRDQGRYERSRSRERRKRSPSPYDDREKRRRVDSDSR